ncbi:DUF4920 domain-containing protein [Neolewinella antarctica]|uniref:DUF4920 domain-containing protein n=1 Tax=Neolewinella antarctica TaxID=442734 RepID=A0ABX0X8C4_9BACT|nr:DUF4920 domain-containing protein [Neolewinella antarctica]NJC25402.1 hypothetical protein [Neolewinella antarctica]
MKFLTHGFICAVLLICAFACTQPQSATEAERTAVVPVQLNVENAYGAEFEPLEVVAAPSFISRYTEKEIADTINTVLRGEVTEVCQAKGCWMTINSGQEDEIMVKFKDYGFFMPKDISGREVVMNGMAYYQITPVDELRHYAEDAGKDAAEIAAITEPVKELRFLADGVKLLK